MDGHTNTWTSIIIGKKTRYTLIVIPLKPQRWAHLFNLNVIIGMPSSAANTLTVESHVAHAAFYIGYDIFCGVTVGHIFPLNFLELDKLTVSYYSLY